MHAFVSDNIIGVGRATCSMKMLALLFGYVFFIYVHLNHYTLGSFHIIKFIMQFSLPMWLCNTSCFCFTYLTHCRLSQLLVDFIPLEWGGWEHTRMMSHTTSMQSTCTTCTGWSTSSLRFPSPCWLPWALVLESLCTQLFSSRRRLPLHSFKYQRQHSLKYLSMRISFPILP